MKRSSFFNFSSGKRLRIKISAARRAQIEISFNWIFVLIAGAAILGFFIMVTKHETKASTDQTARSISGKLDSLLSAIQQNPDAVQTQESIDVEIEFHCDVSGHYYNLKDSKSSTYLESQIIFTPKTVGDSKTIAWTQLYSSPYPVVQLLYFTDDKTKYIFFDSNAPNKIREMYLKMPALFEKNLSTKAQIESMDDQGFRKYVIVGATSDVSQANLKLKPSMEKKTTVVGISTDSKSVSFREGNELRSTTTYYPNDETLYGAIISADSGLYGCAMEKLMQSARIVGEINSQRAELISNNLQLSQKCRLYFISEAPADYIKYIIGNSTYLEGEDYRELDSAITSLQNINREMARANCPTIY